MKNKKAIVVLSFNRPQYLKQVLEGLKLNDLSGWDIILSQDGFLDRFDLKQHSSLQIQNECIRIFTEIFPNGKILQQQYNYGPDYIYRSLYKVLFDEYETLLLFDDDLVPVFDYVNILNRLNEETKHIKEIGAITAYGPDRFISYKEQLLGVNNLEVAQPNWGFLINREQYNQRAPILNRYFDLLHGMNPRSLDEELLLKAYFNPLGSRVASTSVDTADTLAMIFVGQIKLTTKTRNATYIGREGFHFTGDQYLSGYYDKDTYRGVSNITSMPDIPAPTKFHIPSIDQLKEWNQILRECGLI